MHLIESWGTGIRRMIASCKEYGLREPGSMEVGGSFRVELYRPSYRKITHISNEDGSFLRGYD